MDPKSKQASNTNFKPKSGTTQIKPMDVSSDKQGVYCNGVECFVL